MGKTSVVKRLKMMTVGEFNALYGDVTQSSKRQRTATTLNPPGRQNQPHPVQL